MEKGYKHHPIQMFAPISKDGTIMTNGQLSILLQGHNFLHTSASVHVCDLEILLTLAKTRTKFVSGDKGEKKVNV